MIWFTGDTHFNHNKIINYCSRPFMNKDEHDEVLISNWNNLVSHRDTVYHLGDFCYGGHDIVKRYRHRLNGKIILVMGNHDYRNRIHNINNIFTDLVDILELNYNKMLFVLCHYPLASWNKSNYGSYMLHGHSHNNMEIINNRYDVGVDGNNFCPINIEQIVEKININNYYLDRKGDCYGKTKCTC